MEEAHPLNKGLANIVLGLKTLELQLFAWSLIANLLVSMLKML